jgi:alkylation response protein AidB-like acyl-CoA dehydrogenase
MELLEYTDAQREYRRGLRDYLAREVAPHVAEWERARIVPKEAWRRLGRAGYLCPMVAPEYGGRGGDFRYAVIGIEEFSRTWHSGLMASLHSDVVVPYIEAFGSEEIRRRFLPGCVSGDVVTAVAMTEPGAGSDLAAIQTAAVEAGETVTLDGSKTFISNGINADLVVVAARDPAVADPYQALSLYLVESGTPGFTRGRHLEKMGMWSQDTAELFFTRCRIPRGNRLGEKGAGFRMLMDKLQQERLVCALSAVCAAERMLEWAVAALREAVESGRPRIKRQACQFALVEMATEVKLGRTFVEKLAADHREKQAIVVETSMAKYWTTEMAKRVADRILDLMGDEGVLERHPIARAFRDVRIMTIFAGTNEVMKGIAAKFMGL